MIKTESITSRQKRGAAAAELARPVDSRYHTLDVWRGVACLMIVVLHATFYLKYDETPAALADAPVGARILSVMSRFGAGVPMFFVISGYCIAATVDSSRRRSTGTRDFFLRRFRRIFPPYWYALAFTILLTVAVHVAGYGGLLSDPGARDTGVIPHPRGLSASQWVGNLTLTEHWRHHAFGGPELKILGPSWSLSYEEQFYAICGLILAVAARRFFVAVAAVSALTFVTAVVAWQVGPHRVSGFFFDGRWLLFAVGVFVYRYVIYDRPSGHHAVAVGLVVVMLATVLFRYVFLKSGTIDQRSQAFEYVVGAIFGVVLLALHPWDRRVSGLLPMRPLAWCGRMCYSLYLIHWPITKLAAAALFTAGVRGVWPTLALTVPVCVALSLAASWAFFQLVERRFLNAPSSRTARLREASLVPANIVSPAATTAPA